MNKQNCYNLIKIQGFYFAKWFVIQEIPTVLEQAHDMYKKKPSHSCSVTKVTAAVDFTIKRYIACNMFDKLTFGKELLCPINLKNASLDELVEV